MAGALGNGGVPDTVEETAASYGDTSSRRVSRLVVTPAPGMEGGERIDQEKNSLSPRSLERGKDDFSRAVTFANIHRAADSRLVWGMGWGGVGTNGDQ